MRTRGKFYGENTPKRKRKRNCDPCSFSNSSICSSKVSICSSKMSSKLPELHDEELLLYLEHLSMDDKQLGESHSYYRWESVSQNLAKKVGNSLDTNACILASRGHETMYSKYFERNPRLLKHPTLGSSNYLRALHNIYRKTIENVLRHPSTTVGPIRSGRSHGSGSRSHGITPYSSGQSSRSHGITPTLRGVSWSQK